MFFTSRQDKPMTDGERGSFRYLMDHTRGAVFRLAPSGEPPIYLLNDIHERGSGILYVLGSKPCIPIHALGYRSVSRLSLRSSLMCKPYSKVWFLRGFFTDFRACHFGVNLFVMDGQGQDVVMVNEYETDNPDGFTGEVLQDLPGIDYQRHVIKDSSTATDYVVVGWETIRPAMTDVPERRERVEIKIMEEEDED